MPKVVAVNETIKRDVLVSRLLDKHRELGGVQSATNPNSQVKKALQDMMRSGEVQKLAVAGYWRYLGSSEVLEDELPSSPSEASVEDDEPFEVLNVSGSGRGLVYVYYFPAYYSTAHPYPIKIGMSRGHYQARIASQLGTSNPERPVIYRLHHCDEPGMLERYLHTALTIMGALMVEAPGTEWFKTSPAEIDRLLEAVGQLAPKDAATEDRRVRTIE